MGAALAATRPGSVGVLPKGAVAQAGGGAHGNGPRGVLPKGVAAHVETALTANCPGGVLAHVASCPSEEKVRVSISGCSVVSI